MRSSTKELLGFGLRNISYILKAVPCPFISQESKNGSTLLTHYGATHGTVRKRQRHDIQKIIKVKLSLPQPDDRKSRKDAKYCVKKHTEAHKPPQTMDKQQQSHCIRMDSNQIQQGWKSFY